MTYCYLPSTVCLKPTFDEPTVQTVALLLRPCARFINKRKDLLKDMEQLYINIGVTVLLSVLKDPKKKEKFRKIAKKVFDAIRTAFPGDPDFD